MRQALSHMGSSGTVALRSLFIVLHNDTQIYTESSVTLFNLNVTHETELVYHWLNTFRIFRSHYHNTAISLRYLYDYDFLNRIHKLHSKQKYAYNTHSTTYIELYR